MVLTTHRTLASHVWRPVITIVKATPIVECGELTPGTYEVTVPYEPIKISDIKTIAPLARQCPTKMWELQITTSGILWST